MNTEEKNLLDEILKKEKEKNEQEQETVVIRKEDNELLERVDKKLIIEDGRQLLRD